MNNLQLKYKVSLKTIIVVFTITLTLFSNFINKLINLKVFNFLDEFLLMIFFLPLINLRRYKKFSFYIATSLLYFIIISIVQQSSSYFNIILQSVIHLKFFIFLIVFDKYVSLNQLNIFIKLTFIITLFGIILNFIFPNIFNVFSNPDFLIKPDISQIYGFQLSSNSLSLTIVLFFSYFLQKTKYSFFSSSIVFMVFLSFLIIIGSRTSILSLFIVYMIWINIKFIKNKFILNSIFLIMFFVISFVFSESEIIDRTVKNISMIQNSDEGYIRGLMLISSLKLFISFFPFGSGAATFGSVLSENSQVYSDLGLSNKSFFLEMTGIFDSNWASLVGEFGLIGLIVFSFILYKSFIFLSNRSEELNKFIILSIIFVIVLCGLTMPVFMNGYLAIIFSVFLIYYKKISC